MIDLEKIKRLEKEATRQQLEATAVQGEPLKILRELMDRAYNDGLEDKDCLSAATEACLQRVLASLADTKPVQGEPVVCPEHSLVQMIDSAMVEMANIHPPLKRSECKRLILAAISAAPAASPVAAEPVVLPTFSHIAKRKLFDLMGEGHQITGYALQHANGKRCWLDAGGMVLWPRLETERDQVNRRLNAEALLKSACADMQGKAAFVYVESLQRAIAEAEGGDCITKWDGVIRATDFHVSTFGGGGAWVHRPDYGVTIVHTPTGLMESCDDDKHSVHRNKATAMERLQTTLTNLEGGGDE